MPIYEYACGGCGHEFEKLVRRDAAPPCPACGAVNVERLFSLPNVSSETTKGKAMRAAKKRDRTQAVDRVEAQRAYERNHDD
jgi:putative FmdB family regulatory protein